MRQDTKGLRAVWITGLLLCAIPLGAAACTAGGANEIPAEHAQTPAGVALIAAVETPAAVQAEGSAPAPDEDADPKTLAAYRGALMALLHNHVLPDGTDCGYDASGDAAGNRFAILDVDADGRDELILVYTTAPMAGQTQAVYDYDGDTGKLRCELAAFPMLTFYDNGVVWAGWSHSQGLADQFWPFTLYRYDPQTDAYPSVGMVDAWEKGFAAQDWQGKPFPDDVDKSGTGVVYYIMTNGAQEAVAPVDASVYDAWYTSCLGGASARVIQYAALTRENLAAIGSDGGFAQ